MQTQTSNTLHNAIMEAGSKDRPPMLAPGNYIQWKSRIKRYIDTKPNHELIHYCLENPPYKLDWKDIEVPVSEGSPITTTARIHETYKNVTQEIRDQLNAEDEADGESLESYYSRNGNVAGARETVGSTVVQKSSIQCYNCKEFRHVARKCQKPKRAKDAAYHREKMLLCKQEEARIQLNAEQADWKDDTKRQEIDQNDDDNDLAKERELLASLIEKLKCEIDESKNQRSRLSHINVNKGKSKEVFNKQTTLLEKWMDESIPLDKQYEVTNLQCDYLELLEKCEGLETELSNSKMMSKSFESVQQHAINLKIELQQCKEKIKDDKLFKVNKTKDFCKEREQYFEIQDLKAQLQDKGIVINFAPNKKSILKNTNVLAPGMYKLHTDHNHASTSQLPQDSRKTNKRVSFSTEVILTTSVSRPQLKSNPMGDRVMRNNSQGKKQEVEDQRRNVKLPKNKTSVTACNDSLNAKTLNVNSVYATCDKCVLHDKHDMCVLTPVTKPIKRTVVSESNKKPRNFTRKLYERVSKTCSWWYSKFTPSGYKWKPKSGKEIVNPNLVEIVLFIVDSGCSKHMTGNLKLLINFIEKFLGMVKFGNDQISPILGYGDLVQGAVTIKRVYYVEGLNHNLFSVGQFCDVDLEVAFQKSTCYIRDLKGNDLLTSSRGTDLYSITLQDTNCSNLICLMAKASSYKAWLWHRRLSHLNFDT
nr:integrase, catalytic region, zinc finger, CCHC-type, peptidase aspartic, catalytic [Tanacetum cinerariifolium]